MTYTEFIETFENIASQFMREAAHKNLYCAVINGAANRELLKTVPHE